MTLLCALLAASLALTPVWAAFGFTTSGNSLIIDTGANLVFTVDKTTGDITSMNFNGKQAQDQSKHSHIASGIGASCSISQSGTIIKVTCTTSTLTQYYVAKSGDPAIHMATFTTAEPSVGELRFIARLNAAVVTGGPTQSNIKGGTAIEGSDVFTVGGQTRSKFYSSVPFIRDQVHGVTGSGIGVFMIIPGVGYEKSSGGPFFRDINNQNGDQNELYFYMNSGHTQTESFRQGLHGPYALWFTTGSTPGTERGPQGTSFWDSINPSGYVANSGRGFVSGKAIDIPSSFASQTFIGWKNSANQYWATAESNGNFFSPAMIPGSYTMTLYKNQLEVGSQSVSVSAGSTNSGQNIHSAEANVTAIWQYGEFDGTPNGFLNADMIETMHPSDSRMHEWPRTITVGQQGDGFVPMVSGIAPLVIRFALASGQGGARTLEIGTTLAFAGGRPIVTVNSWSSSTPAVPSQPDSRGVTRGTWRGNNIRYTYSIPSGVLNTGSTVNTLTINVASGSSGDQFLSPNVVLDAIRLV
ncbi:polysaccharide lyase family 4 protein [Auricularia subglabra TFB-10046 SS5]|nr:polysaccharide lyase family 4 protein [Auricularia subglabra TFB-10046 SS5]